MNKKNKVIVAATQMSCSWEIEENLSKAKEIIYDAAKKGANIILLQELFQTPYFCIQYEEKIFCFLHIFQTDCLKNISHVMEMITTLEWAII